MNQPKSQPLQTILNAFRNKRILILGFGREGRSTYRLLRSCLPEADVSVADANRRLAPEIETLIIPTAQEFAHISSSAVRDILRHNGDTSLFLPEGVVLPPWHA